MTTFLVVDVYTVAITHEYAHDIIVTGASSSIHIGLACTSDSDSELSESPFNIGSTPPAAEVFTTLDELMRCHKRSLHLDEDHVKRIRAYRDEFWNESIVVFKHPGFDYKATPRIVFAGEAGVDAGGLGREYGTLLRNAILSAKANLFEGQEERKLPLYSIDGIHSRLFQLAGKMVAYLIIHLDIGIPCLSPAVYNYIATGCVTPDCCSVDDIVDFELKELISQVIGLHYALK